MTELRLPLIAALLMTTVSAAQAATMGNGITAYALGNEGRTLVTVADGTAGPATGVTLDFGMSSTLSLDTLAWRPQTGQLYGYDDAYDTVFEINTTTGVATAVVSAPGVTTNDDLGMDFNNVLDAARIVSAEEENVVFFPNTAPPSLSAKTPLHFAAGDMNEGQNPNVVMNAYTNAIADATTTQQYVLDSDWNLMATLANNAGTLNTVGGLFLNGMAFDITEDGGFDILSLSQGNNTAYALLTTGWSQAIYQVPLIADGMGRVNLTWVMDVTTDFGMLDGFAVYASDPTMAAPPVPVPASVLLMGTGIAALGAVRRLRRRG